jgi:hypothetical protein
MLEHNVHFKASPNQFTQDYNVKMARIQKQKLNNVHSTHDNEQPSHQPHINNKSK